MRQRWKDITNYTGRYRISDYGQVKHGSKLLMRGFTVNKNGNRYYTIVLSLNGETKKFRINRLVAMAFIPNPENKPEVNHIDGDTENNYYKNLEWNTGSENQKHAYKLGLNTPRKGELCGKSKLTEKQVSEIKAMNGFYLGTRVAKKYNVHKTTIYAIWKNKTWIDTKQTLKHTDLF
jgi:hypothetical protein